MPATGPTLRHWIATDRNRRIAAIVGLVGVGCVCLACDYQLAEWLIADGLPGDVRALFQRVEAFGHTYGLICFAVTIYVLDPAGRRHLGSLISAFAAAGLSADLIKVQFWRWRPRAFFEQADGGVLGIEETFVGSIWWDAGRASVEGIALNHDFHSFPSAHTACAVALSCRLGRAYPRGKWWFTTLAILCACNRVDGGAHFLSDVLWGAALGLAVGYWLPTPKIPRRWTRSRAGNVPRETRGRRYRYESPRIPVTSDGGRESRASFDHASKRFTLSMSLSTENGFRR